MLTWLIEHGGKRVPLENVNAAAIRAVIDPIKNDLALTLAAVTTGEALDVVFVVDEDGSVSVRLHGDPMAVNTARDILGDRHRIGPRLS